MSKVEVRPLPRKSWHEKKGEQSFTRNKTVQVLVNPNTNAYDTGLTEEEEIKYSKILGVDLSNKFIQEEPHPYWSSNAAKLTLSNNTTVYDTDIPREYVKIKNLMACKFVANSMKEWNEGKFPFATHVIHNEDQETESKAVLVNVKKNAYALAMKLTKEAKCDIIQILENKSVRGKSDSFVDVIIDDIITKSPEEFVKFANLNPSDTYLTALVLEAIYQNILTKEGTGICYMGDVIAHSIEDAVEYFKDPNNQNQKIRILGKMTGSRKLESLPEMPKNTEVLKEVAKSIEPKTEEIKAPVKTEDIDKKTA